MSGLSDELIKEIHKNSEEDNSRLATIVSTSIEGNKCKAVVRFYGDEENSNISYSVLYASAPAAGDTVVMQKVGGSYVITGKMSMNAAEQENAAASVLTLEQIIPSIILSSAVSEIDRNASYKIPALKLCVLSFRILVGNTPVTYTDVIGSLPAARQNRQYAASNGSKGIIGAVSILQSGRLQLASSLNMSAGNYIEVSAVYFYD